MTGQETLQIARLLKPQRRRMDGFHDQQVPYCNSKVSEAKIRSQTQILLVIFNIVLLSLLLFNTSFIYPISSLPSSLLLLLLLPNTHFLPQGPFKLHLIIIRDKQLNEVPTPEHTYMLSPAPCYYMFILS